MTNGFKMNAIKLIRYRLTATHEQLFLAGGCWIEINLIVFFQGLVKMIFRNVLDEYKAKKYVRKL